MLTEKDYCDYETCVALKELGIPRRLIEYVIPEDRDRIHLWNAQKWLREEKNIIVRIIPIYDLSTPINGATYTNEIVHWEVGYVEDTCIRDYDTYEEALLEGVREAIKILREEK